MRKRRRTSLCLAIAGALLACDPGFEPKPDGPDPATLRTIGQGAVVGWTTGEGAHAWHGIPFAAPPVGELRWRAPRPPARFGGTFEALAFGPSCVQFAGPGGGRDGAGSGEATGSEDCLYLNVFAPPFAPDAVPEGDDRLPVMVWIHGGGNTVGDAVFYDGSVLARERNVVVVTIHYRLGVFGWFSHPALRAGARDADERSGNFGTLDIVRALEWVRDEIPAFGGDPARVTVFGESAGGSNTFSMIFSPRARGLFQRAIVQSGSFRWTAPAHAEADADAPEAGHAFSSREVVARHLIADGRAADRAAARRVADAMGDAELAAYLRGRGAADVLAAYEGTGMGGMYQLPKLFRDGHVLPSDEGMDAIARGAYNRVPVILGSNRDEAKLFMLFGSPHVTKALGMPLWLNDSDRYHASAEHVSLMWKARGVDDPARAMRAVQGPSVWAYRFDWDAQPDLLWLELNEVLGAAHGLDIPFVFGRLRLGPATGLLFDADRRAQDERLAAAMTSYWTEFAHRGAPGRGRDGRLPLWESWGSDGAGGAVGAREFIVLDTEDDGGIRMAGGGTTKRAVIAGVAGDTRLPEARDRCAIYRDFVRWGAAMTEDDYVAIEDGLCRELPIDAHPWEG